LPERNFSLSTVALKRVHFGERKVKMAFIFLPFLTFSEIKKKQLA